MYICVHAYISPLSFVYGLTSSFSFKAILCSLCQNIIERILVDRHNPLTDHFQFQNMLNQALSYVFIFLHILISCTQIVVLLQTSRWFDPFSEAKKQPGKQLSSAMPRAWLCGLIPGACKYCCSTTAKNSSLGWQTFLMVKLSYSAALSAVRGFGGVLQPMAVKLTGGGAIPKQREVSRDFFPLEVDVCHSCCSFSRLKSFLLCSSYRVWVCTSFIHFRHSGNLHLVIWSHQGMLV